MTVLSADASIGIRHNASIINYPVADNVLIYKDSLVCIDTAGYARPAADTASYIFVGKAKSRVDNTVTGHTAGGKNIDVDADGILVGVPTTGATQASVGTTVYVADSGSVASTATNYVVAGIVARYNSSTSVDVRISALPSGISGVSGLTATAGELNQLHSVTPGTVSASKAVVVGASKNVDVLTVTNLTTTQMHLGAATAEAYGATVSIDSTKEFHRIAGANGTSATSTFNASTTGADGDMLIIEVTSTAAGTCTITFGTNFKPSGTLAVTASHFANVLFISDGTNWKEHYRSAIIAS